MTIQAVVVALFCVTGAAVAGFLASAWVRMTLKGLRGNYEMWRLAATQGPAHFRETARQKVEDTQQNSGRGWLMFTVAFFVGGIAICGGATGFMVARALGVIG